MSSAPGATLDKELTASSNYSGQRTARIFKQKPTVSENLSENTMRSANLAENTIVLKTHIIEVEHTDLVRTYFLSGLSIRETSFLRTSESAASRGARQAQTMSRASGSRRVTRLCLKNFRIGHSVAVHLPPYGRLYENQKRSCTSACCEGACLLWKDQTCVSCSGCDDTILATEDGPRYTST